MSLLEFQRRMAHDVSRPLTADFSMQETASDGTFIGEDIASYVKPNDRLSSFERLEIYNRQYWFRLIAAVSEDYPALNALVGQQLFDALILAYLQENPSTSYSLRDLGASLPSWMERHPELTGSIQEAAVDVARLEWAYIEAFDSATLSPLNGADLATLVPSSVISLQPHLQLLALSYAADEIVLAVRKNTPAGDIVSNAVMKKKRGKRLGIKRPRPEKTYLVVHRYQDCVYYRRIEHEAFLLLSAMQSGEPMAMVVQRAFVGSTLTSSEQARKIRDCFTHAAELGWFVMPS